MEAFTENVIIVPYIANISKGKLDLFIHNHFKELIGRCEKSGIYIGNLGWIDEFKQAGIKVYGDFGLNINNIDAGIWETERGFFAVVASPGPYGQMQNVIWL